MDNIEYTHTKYLGKKITPKTYMIIYTTDNIIKKKRDDNNSKNREKELYLDKT